MMKTLIAVALAVLAAGTALAGSGYDRCLGEEKELRAREADRCSGLAYTFNPSACFAARKALAPYDSGRCRAIGREENVQPQEPAPAAAEKASARREPSREELAAENARLKEENIRLRQEIDRLRRDRGAPGS
jgi:hypothetical protein